MKTVTVVLVAVLLGFPNTGLSTEKKAAPPYRAESSAYIVQGKDAWTYVTENRSFRFAEVLDDTGNYEAPLLLEETFHNERTDSVEGVRGNATVKAWTVERSGKRELRWTLKEIGNEGKVQDRFYRVTAWGCCDVPVVYSYYSVLTGKKLYASNSDLLEVRGDGEGPLAARYAAFGYAGMNELSRPPQLQYGTDKKVAQRFSVISSRGYYDAPQMFVFMGLSGVLLKHGWDTRLWDIAFALKNYGTLPALSVGLTADVFTDNSLRLQTIESPSVQIFPSAEFVSIVRFDMGDADKVAVHAETKKLRISVRIPYQGEDGRHFEYTAEVSFVRGRFQVDKSETHQT